MVNSKTYTLRLKDGTSIEFEADAYEFETSEPVRIQFYLKDVLVVDVECNSTEQKQ